MNWEKLLSLDTQVEKEEQPDVFQDYPISFNSEDEDLKKHKLGCFYAEREMMNLICTSTGTAKENGYVRHPLVYLMEAADDIAYATADLEDALKKGLFTLDQFVHFFDEQVERIEDSHHKYYSGVLIEDLQQRLEGNSGSEESDMVSFQKWMELVKKWLMYVAVYRFCI